MRSYLIDEVASSDLKKAEEFLCLNSIPSGLRKIFWVAVPAQLLSKKQARHFKCRPHLFAAELGTHWIKIESFVRSLSRMQCECQAYCINSQERFIFYVKKPGCPARKSREEWPSNFGGGPTTSGGRYAPS